MSGATAVAALAALLVGDPPQPPAAPLSPILPAADATPRPEAGGRTRPTPPRPPHARLAGHEPAPPPQPAPQTPPPLPAVLRAIYAADPPVEALRAAATALALAEPARARSLVTRARVAGWLPELRLRADRRFARAESVDLGPSLATPLAPVGIDSDNDVRYEARLTWDLSRIAFNPDEIGAQFQALRTADARREVESLVIKLYFERRRLKAEYVAADAHDVAGGMRLEVRIAEIEAELDALSGGAFSRLAHRDAGFEGPAADQ